MSAMNTALRTVTLAFTGASGLAYGMRLLECLLQAGQKVQLVYTAAAQIVAAQEMDFTLPARPKEAVSAILARLTEVNGELLVYGNQDWFSPLASGSNPADAMVICPCSMATLGKISHGIGDDLICRAADVMLKERRPLILVPRELPYSSIHLENMLRLSQAGAVLLPPAPGFYHHPKTVSELVDFVVARILDQLAIPQSICPKWGTPEQH